MMPMEENEIGIEETLNIGGGRLVEMRIDSRTHQ
jgi:hypothetical protein